MVECPRTSVYTGGQLHKKVLIHILYTIPVLSLAAFQQLSESQLSTDVGHLGKSSMTAGQRWQSMQVSPKVHFRPNTIEIQVTVHHKSLPHVL